MKKLLLAMGIALALSVAWPSSTAKGSDSSDLAPTQARTCSLMLHEAATPAEAERLPVPVPPDRIPENIQALELFCRGQFGPGSLPDVRTIVDGQEVAVNGAPGQHDSWDVVIHLSTRLELVDGQVAVRVPDPRSSPLPNTQPRDIQLLNTPLQDTPLIVFAPAPRSFPQNIQLLAHYPDPLTFFPDRTPSIGLTNSDQKVSHSPGRPGLFNLVSEEQDDEEQDIVVNFPL